MPMFIVRRWGKDCNIAGRTHVSGHGYNMSGVEFQRELISIVLGSCSISLTLCKDDMTVLQMQAL